MAEGPNPSQESVEVRRVCEELKNADTVEGIRAIISRREVDCKLVDDCLFNENPSQTLIGLIIEKASAAWPGNTEEVIALLKTQIEKGADLTRAVAIESKKDSRDHLKILLEIIFREIRAGNAVNGKPFLDILLEVILREIRAIAAANGKYFLDILLENILREIRAVEAANGEPFLDILLENILREIRAVEAANGKPFLGILLENILREICSAGNAANGKPFLDILSEKVLKEIRDGNDANVKPFLDILSEIIARGICAGNAANVKPFLDILLDIIRELAGNAANVKPFLGILRKIEDAAKSENSNTLKDLRKKLCLHKIITDPYFLSMKWLLETTRDGATGGSQSATDDIFVKTLRLASDIKDEISSTDSYLKTEYQKLSDQAEEFAVALLDEVENDVELSTVIKMEDKFKKGVDDEGIKEVSLIQHAINLRCKVFVVSKNCQYLLKKEIFGETMYSGFWDDPRIKTGTWMPPLWILLMKAVLSFLRAALKSLPLVVLFYWLLSLFDCCFKKECRKVFIDFYERPYQKYLLELWWFIAFLSLIIIRSNDEIFSENDSLSGLTTTDIAVLVFVVAFCLRRLTSFLLKIKIIRKIPRYWQNWHLFPDILTVVECTSLLFFVIAFMLWIIRWHQVDGWRPSDDTFQAADLLYSLGSLLCFFKLAHYLKAEYALGALNLSLYMMITKDVIYFAIIFVLLFFVPFATALKKMYSYYVVDAMKNATQPLVSYSQVYDDLLWTMLLSDKRRDIDIKDSNFYHVKILAELYFAVFTLVAVIVAFNMWIATMNNTYENIMQNLDKEYVFSRTRMWMEYIATDRSALPPPLNLTDIFTCVKSIFYLCKCLVEEGGAQGNQGNDEQGRATCCISFNCMDDCCKSKEENERETKRKTRISIINRLVVRYLCRSLKLDDNTEYLQNGPLERSASPGHNDDSNPSSSNAC